MLLLLIACVSSHLQELPATAANPADLVGTRLVDTPDGLSGLTLDPDGVPWAVAERDEVMVALNDDGTVAERMKLDDVKNGLELESITWMDAGRLALGTEQDVHNRDEDRILVMRVGDRDAEVDEKLRVSYAPFGMLAEDNHGLEAICHADGALLAGAEDAVVEDGRRYAPLWLLPANGGEARTLRLRLSTAKGKLSALDCRADGDGLRLVAVERHFGVARLLAARVGATDTTVTPSTVIDLRPALEVLDPDANIEGIARLPDGRLLMVTDDASGKLRSTPWLLRYPAID